MQFGFGLFEAGMLKNPKTLKRTLLKNYLCTSTFAHPNHWPVLTCPDLMCDTLLGHTHVRHGMRELRQEHLSFSCAQ